MQLGRFPDAKQFILETAPSIANLRVEWERGLDPMLIMRTAGGAEVPVHGWKADTFREFFEAKLKKA